MVKVSVIIPCYNVAEYLEKCLDSVCNQTLRDIEIICVNDGSEDNTADILERYAQKDERIRVISQENKGQSVARNKALDVARGDYIFFVDSDDYIHLQALEVLVKVAENSGAEIVATDRFNQLSKNESFEQNLDCENLQYEMYNNPLEQILSVKWASSVIWSKLYLRKFVQNRRFIEGIYFEDWPFITCLFADVKRYATVPYALYFYNDLSVSTMRSVFTTRKIDDYVSGINFTHNYFMQEKYIALRDLVRTKRIMPSINMMINKTLKEKNGQPELSEYLFNTLRKLQEQEKFFIKDLSVKQIIRIMKLWVKKITF